MDKESTINLLQLSPSFPKEELRKAFRRWSLILHPDKHVDPEIKKIADILYGSVLYPARLELERTLQSRFS